PNVATAAPLTVRAGLVRRVLVPAPVTLLAQAVQQVELVVKAAQVVGVAEESFDLRDDPFGVKGMRLHRVSFLTSCRGRKNFLTLAPRATAARLPKNRGRRGERRLRPPHPARFPLRLAPVTRVGG